MFITLSTILEITEDCSLFWRNPSSCYAEMNDFERNSSLFNKLAVWIYFLYDFHSSADHPLIPAPGAVVFLSAKNVFRGSQFHWTISVPCFYMLICISGQKRLFIYYHHWSSPESIICFCLWPSILLTAVVSASLSRTFYSSAASEYE